MTLTCCINSVTQDVMTLFQTHSTKSCSAPIDSQLNVVQSKHNNTCIFNKVCYMFCLQMISGVPREGVGGSNPPPRNSEGPPNRAKLKPIVKTVKFAKFRTPTPQDVRKKGSKILKLPPVRSCFTLAMANKLGIIINSLKLPKIKKILLYEMKFLVSNYSCLQYL